MAEQGEACQVRLTVKNDGHMPVGRIRLEILGEFQNLTVTRGKFTGALRPGGRPYCRFPSPQSTVGFFFHRAVRVTVYDYLSLFRKKKKMDLSWKTLIFPGEYSLNLRFSDGGGDEGGEALEVSPLPAEGGYEIRQIREYREGDPIRHIHWNQTAKTDTLWIREYQEEARPKVRLLLEMTGLHQMPPVNRDAFYQTAYALLAGILDCHMAVLVHWRDGITGKMEYREILKKEQRMELFARLYEAEEEDKEGGRQRETEGPEGNYDNLFRLLPDLSWYPGRPADFPLFKRKSGDGTDGEGVYDIKTEARPHETRKITVIISADRNLRAAVPGGGRGSDAVLPACGLRICSGLWSGAVGPGSFRGKISGAGSGGSGSWMDSGFFFWRGRSFWRNSGWRAGFSQGSIPARQ